MSLMPFRTLDVQTPKLIWIVKLLLFWGHCGTLLIMYQIAKGNNHFWLHKKLLWWTGALNYDIYSKASPNFTANLVLIYEIHIPLCFPNIDYYFLELILILNINKNMSVSMETASQHIKLFLRTEKRDKTKVWILLLPLTHLTTLANDYIF